jgi:chromosome segregation ATPase
MRRFFNVLQADVYRANDLELGNISLTTEQKKLSEQLGDAARKQHERESLIEGLRQRETHLSQDNDALRAAIAAAKLELVEAATLNAQNEAKFGDAIKALSARTVEVERSTREIEVLREKQVSLSIELDKALKREAEAQRKLEELSTIHANEAAQHSDVLVALGKSEKEVVRLQVALESTQLKQAEMAEATLIAESDREAEAARSVAEQRGLRSEIETLQSKLEFATSERSEALGEIAKYKAQWSEAMADKQVADEKLAALIRENESAQQNLSAASANISQLALQQETEQIQLDIHRQECEDLRAEIAALNARIKDLLPFERLYKVTQARQRENGNGAAELAGVTAVKTRNSGRRSASPSRGRAI